MVTENDLLEPRKAYEAVVKDEFRKNAEEYFDNLVAESGIDVAANQATMEEYQKCVSQKQEVAKERSKKKSQGNALITFAIISIVVAVAMLFIFINIGAGSWMLPVLGIVVPIILVGFAIFLFIVYGKKVKPVLKNQGEIIARLDSAIKEKQSLGYSQMEALNNSYGWNMHIDIVNKTIPTFKLDKYYDHKRRQYLMDSFGFDEKTNKNSSIVHVQSGEMMGNPFIVETLRVMEMGTYTYTGSLTVSYRVQVRNSDGKGYHTETRTETLHASLTKPKPYYNYEKFIYYGCDAAPELCFSRGPSGVNNMDEKALKKYLASEEKKLGKMVDEVKELQSGFTPLANKEFETLFHAWDRNNEVQFRLLFTPMAQRNYVDIIKNKEPYGDDFYFKKINKLNKIRTHHSQFVDYVMEPDKYKHYSYNAAKQMFIDENEKFFKSFYFDMANLLSIPLYQQYPTDEFIFKDGHFSNNTMFENEAIANSFPEDTFKPKDCATPLILKANYLRSEGSADRVGVSSSGFITKDQLTYVPVVARDGVVHKVPVHWVEYLPVSCTKQIDVIHHDMTRAQYNKKMKSNEFINFRNNCALGGRIIYKRGFYAFLTNEEADFNEASFAGLLKDEE